MIESESLFKNARVDKIKKIYEKNDKSKKYGRSATSNFYTKNDKENSSDNLPVDISKTKSIFEERVSMFSRSPDAGIRQSPQVNYANYEKNVDDTSSKAKWVRVNSSEIPSSLEKPIGFSLDQQDLEEKIPVKQKAQSYENEALKAINSKPHSKFSPSPDIKKDDERLNQSKASRISQTIEELPESSFSVDKSLENSRPSHNPDMSLSELKKLSSTPYFVDNSLVQRESMRNVPYQPMIILSPPQSSVQLEPVIYQQSECSKSCTQDHENISVNKKETKEELYISNYDNSVSVLDVNNTSGEKSRIRTSYLPVHNCLSDSIIENKNEENKNEYYDAIGVTIQPSVDNTEKYPIKVSIDKIPAYDKIQICTTVPADSVPVVQQTKDIPLDANNLCDLNRSLLEQPNNKQKKVGVFKEFYRRNSVAIILLLVFIAIAIAVTIVLTNSVNL